MGGSLEGDSTVFPQHSPTEVFIWGFNVSRYGPRVLNYILCFCYCFRNKRKCKVYSECLPQLMWVAVVKAKRQSSQCCAWPLLSTLVLHEGSIRTNAPRTFVPLTVPSTAAPACQDPCVPTLQRSDSKWSTDETELAINGTVLSLKVKWNSSIGLFSISHEGWRYSDTTFASQMFQCSLCCCLLLTENKNIPTEL